MLFYTKLKNKRVENHGRKKVREKFLYKIGSPSPFPPPPIPRHTFPSLSQGSVSWCEAPAPPPPTPPPPVPAYLEEFYGAKSVSQSVVLRSSVCTHPPTLSLSLSAGKRPDSSCKLMQNVILIPFNFLHTFKSLITDFKIDVLFIRLH